MKVLIVIVMTCVSISAVWAGEPPTAEHWQAPSNWSAQTRVRYQHLLRSLRCLVCQDESLASSSAPLAADLRRQIRHKIEKGQTNHQIRQYLVNRYGDFVLYKPPFMPSTWLLWIGPFILLVIGLLVVWIQARRHRVQERTAHEPDPATMELSRRLLSETDKEEH